MEFNFRFRLKLRKLVFAHKKKYTFYFIIDFVNIILLGI